MPYPLPLTRTEAYLAYKAGVIQQSDLKPSLSVPRNGIDAWLAYWTGLAADYPKREDGTPHILQEEEAYIAYLCGVINEYPEKCLRRVGAYLRYLISARWGRPDHPLNREELYLSLIKTQVIPSGDPSSDIVINGTAKAPFQDVKMYGDTFQQAYTGKNLANPTPVSGGSNGVFATYNSQTGEVTVSGTAQTTWSNLFKVVDASYLTAGTYTLKQYGELTNGRLTCYARGNGYQVNASTLQTTFTITSDGNAYICITGLTSGSPVSGTIKFQLESGSTATDFESFVGGQPSPNPDYPQPIQTVTGEQTVTVTGKNLFDKDNYSILNCWPTSVLAHGNNWSIWIPCEPNTTYSVTKMICQPTDHNRFRIATTAVEPNYGVAVVNAVNPGTNNTTGQITTGATAKYLMVVLANTDTDPTTTLSEMLGSVQIELGSATTYAPYSKQTLPLDLGSIELCKLGTYQDYIYKDGDDWKVHKATGVVIYDGSNDEGWSKDTSGIYSRMVITIANSLDVGATRKADSLSDHFRANTTNDYGIFFRNNKNTYYYPNSDITTVEEWRAWLSSNNINTLYPLATATDTTITNQALIAQLEALVAGGAENGTTYIKVNAIDPNLPGLLYVEAPKYE